MGTGTLFGRPGLWPEPAQKPPGQRGRLLKYGDRHAVWAPRALTPDRPKNLPANGGRLLKYGDRHAVWAPGALPRTCPSACGPREARGEPVAPLQGETQQSRRLEWEYPESNFRVKPLFTTARSARGSHRNYRSCAQSRSAGAFSGSDLPSRCPTMNSRPLPGSL